jgi:outer membrane protein TolC
MKKLLILIFLVSLGIAHSQDTLSVLTQKDFLQHVKENHPIALVASNNIELAEQTIRMSKGAFDPVLFGGIDQKYYEGKTYYSTISSGVKIPTRIGVDLKLAGDFNKGDYLNPENRIPAGGLTYAGFEVPIGRGLFTDERRTQLKRAQVTFSQSQVEKTLTLNSLLYEAGQVFIYWQEQEAQLILAIEGANLAEMRLQQMRTNFQVGERAAVDTIEASAQYFNRILDVEQRKLNAKNAKLSVENYLWEKGMLPLSLEDSIKPEKLEMEAPISLLNNTENQHPMLTWYDLKLKDLVIERKLKIEMLKPQLTVNYNLLQPAENLVSTQLSFSNYKWGATLYMPILLRKERSSLQISNFKIENTQIEIQQKQRDLRTKQIQNRNEWTTHVNQAQTSLLVADNYKQLSAAERSLFDLGESSLFLINAREISYLSAQSKYLEYAAKTKKSALTEKFALGILGE